MQGAKKREGQMDKAGAEEYDILFQIECGGRGVVKAWMAWSGKKSKCMYYTDAGEQPMG